jgi:hypothetical protein
MPAAHGKSATGVIQPALQCRSNHLSALLPHQQEKVEVPWQILRSALGCMSSGVDQHATHCELSGGTGRGDRLIEGLGTKNHALASTILYSIAQTIWKSRFPMH